MSSAGPTRQSASFSAGPSGSSFGTACPVATNPVGLAAAKSYQKHADEMRQLRELGRFYGFPVK